MTESKDAPKKDALTSSASGRGASRAAKPEAENSAETSASPRGGIPRARSVERQERIRERAQAAPKRLARSFVQLPKKVSPVVLTVAALLVIFLAISIAQPLRNYFEQRAELAEINAQISQQQQERDRLTEELNRYNNEDYIKEQARTRLGLIEKGESAFRILSPEINSTAPGSTPGAEETAPEKGDWYKQLWDSISVPEFAEPEKPHEQEHNLPTVQEPARDKNPTQNP